MTRPIYEPSLQRTDRRLGYTSDQLLRRPAPTQDCCPIKSFVGESTAQTFTPGNSNVVWQTNNNQNPECFTPILFGGSDYYQIRILEDGLYTATCYFTAGTAVAYGVADVALAVYRSDLTQFASKRWTYDSTAGFNDASHSWTFEMDGTGGSNRRIEWQFINFHASIGGTDDNVNGSAIWVEVVKWPGVIVLS